MKQLTFLYLLVSCSAISQTQWIGQYEGTLNGDRVILTLNSAGHQQLKGDMKDSGNTYAVNGTTQGASFVGTAVEANLGIYFDMNATLNGKILSTELAINVYGTIQKMDIRFTKIETMSSQNAPASKGEKNPVAHRTRDAAIVGLWVKESNYSSGYGFNDTYGSMSTTESMFFLADGSMANGQSQTVVSGNNFSGSSGSGNVEVIPGLFWFTSEKKIYLLVTENGKEQTLELGKYYIENGKMLITASNGEKLLLSKR